MIFTRESIESAKRTVYAAMPPTPQYNWPLLKQALGFDVWVKHENHTPLGAFKVRGGLTYADWLRRTHPDVRHVISATRGNHGQSIGFAARQHGLKATVVVPHGNSVEKNAAMRALDVELVEHGEDFQASSEHAAVLAKRDGLHRVPSYHPELVRGVATAYVEFFEALRESPPDVLYVPIGLGSGITGASVARAHCGVKTRLIGVVSTLAPAYQKSFQSGVAIDAPATTAIADGMACRSAVPEALEIIRREVEDVIAVSDEEVASAMRLIYTSTHNVAEGAGAAALAAAIQQNDRWGGKRVGVVLSGGNVDASVLARVLKNEQ
ncbi:threonine dehydratase [Steroidobacter flavus]|uniref:Threonine dehydratase n=1 Tax=Steroidobacter flavus TaxID=1842136 RepID=A0ABV8SRA1_9GAMM